MTRYCQGTFALQLQVTDKLPNKKHRTCTKQFYLKFSLILTLFDICSAVFPQVETETGKVTGSTVYYKGTLINQFLGIPYAEPPVGNLRFRKTVPVQSWPGNLLAFNLFPACVQYYPVPYPWIDVVSREDEDCLYLNIWVPQSCSSDQPKAVMFWVYGGGFSAGSIRKPVYQGYVLAAVGDVIVVTVNYRLGIFGFLSTEDETAPGNMGMYDVLEAFQWMLKNIEAFGGDKNRITVFGESAGALTAAYFAVSPLTKGMFQRMIIQSGGPSDRKDPIVENYELGNKVAEAVGCATANMTLRTAPDKVVACLRTIPAGILHKNVLLIHPRTGRAFLPVYGDEFLPERPTDYIKAGQFHDVSAMTGNVKDEGSVALITQFPEITGLFGEKYPKINKSFGEDILLTSFSDIEDPAEIADYYLSGLEEYDYQEVRRQVYHAMGDFFVFCPQVYLSEKLSGNQKDVYFYYLYHRTRRDVFARWAGVTHFSDVGYVFGRPLVNTLKYTRPEGRLSLEIMRLWSNFAKYGIPSPEWKKFSESEPNPKYLHIYEDPDNYLAEHFENCNFLRKYFGFS